MDQIEKLKLFQQVAKHKSFTQAANTLDLPRSTVTYVIKTLEQEYQTLFFYRNTRHVSLTHEGELFLTEVEQVLEQLDQLHFFHERKQSYQARIRISMPAQVADAFIIPVLKDFQQHYPMVKIMIDTQDRCLDLLEHDLDCVIRVGTVKHELLAAKLLGYSKLMTLVSPAYIAKNGEPKSIKELEQHYAVGYQTEISMKSTYTLAFRDHEIDLNYQVATSDTVTYARAGIEGLGIIQIPEFDARRYIAIGQLQPILTEIAPIQLPITLLMAERKYRTDYLQAFLSWIEQRMKAAL